MPSRDLKLPFPGLVYAIAPERADEMAALLERERIQLLLDGYTDDFRFEASVNWATIHVGVRTLERIWAYSYAYLQLALLYQRLPQGAPVDFGASLESRRALALLSWTHGKAHPNDENPWPPEAITPGDIPDDDRNLTPTDELYLMASGWMLLHEIGHIVLKHPNPATDAESCTQELEADAWASSWMLDRWQEYKDDMRVFQKRTIGIAIAVGIQSGFELYWKKGTLRTHPNIADRLLSFLDRHVAENDTLKATQNELAWYVAIAILHTHISVSDRTFRMKRVHLNFRDYVLTLKENL